MAKVLFNYKILLNVKCFSIKRTSISIVGFRDILKL